MKMILVLQHDNGQREQLAALVADGPFLAAALPNILRAMAGAENLQRVSESIAAGGTFVELEKSGR
jgi:hypothetical protein